MESIWHRGLELFKQLELCADRIAPEGNNTVQQISKNFLYL
jgi:hypothetical protein